MENDSRNKRKNTRGNGAVLEKMIFITPIMVVSLLLRNSSRPIEAGQAVLEQARLTTATFYNIREKINSMKSELSGRLRLGVIPTIDIVEALSRDTIDIAILSGGQSELPAQPRKT
jgi:DNA-binding transcriptional LysR family regulator